MAIHSAISGAELDESLPHDNVGRGGWLSVKWQVQQVKRGAKCSHGLDSKSLQDVRLTLHHGSVQPEPLGILRG